MNTNRFSGFSMAVALLWIPIKTEAADSSDQVAPKGAGMRTEYEEEAARDSVGGSPQKPGRPDSLNASGELSFTYYYLDFSDQNKNKGGVMELDNFRLRVNGRHGDLSIQIRYSFRGNFKKGWVGYQAGDNWQWELGVTQTPFGLLPYSSHNFLYSLPFYIGFEDDNDFGLKTVWNSGGWNLQIAFFKNEEWGDASRLSRSSFDVVSDTQANEETNKLNGRLAHDFKHGGFGSSEIGLSGQWGIIFNSVTEKNGDMWAAAAHFNGVYGPLNLQLEAISYRYHPENPAGVDNRSIEIGGYGASSLVASQAEIYLVNLAYGVPVDWGPIGKLTFYNDYSILAKRADFPISHFNATGCYVSAEPVYAYLDYFLGKNALFLGGGSEPHGAAADSDGEWHARFNINVGYIFNY